MANRDPLDRWRTRVLNRHAARRSARQRMASGFVSQPEPKTIGSFARGRQLLAGNIILAGHFVEAPGEDLWAIDAPDPTFDAARHGFGWLDDLAAVGDVTVRLRHEDHIYTGRAADTDILVASAKAYTNAMNRLLALDGAEIQGEMQGV